MAETQTAVMKYQARDGQTITLSFETIRKYLVQGRSELVNQAELMYFMGVCKSQGMNPFKRDCYLIKYDQTAAAIITSIHFLRSRAKAMTDCTGWEAGIIVMRNKEVVYSNGLMLEGDILLGGWARGKPKGWDKERHHEVNLKGYIKHRKDGSITQFWAEEKQPSQIAKVAEGQLVRALWPDEFQNLYTDAEISPDDDTKLLSDKKIKSGESTEDIESRLVKQFDASIPKDVNLESLATFLSKASETFDKSVDEIKAEAVEDKGFWKHFRIWEKNQKPKKESEGEKDPIRAAYIKLKKAGFGPYVKANLDAILQLAEKYQAEIRAKWQGFYPDEPFPKSGPVEEVEEAETPSEPDEESEAIKDYTNETEYMIPCDMVSREVHVKKKCANTCDDAMRLRCKEFSKWVKAHPDIEL